jgi:Raf kinase inhibitor-like YbhB/YbcL family protein
MRKTPVSVLLALMLVLIGAEFVAAQQQNTPPPSKFKMATTAFFDDDWIPVQYTCGVSDSSSPGVQWSDAPQGTMSFALIFHDTDAAPGKGSMDVTHWILWNIPAFATQLSARILPDTSPDGIQQGKNIRGANGYQPPCPPPGALPHHYVFELYALDSKLSLAAGTTRADLLKAMDGHVVGKASIVGIFRQNIDDKTWRWGTAKQP